MTDNTVTEPVVLLDVDGPVATVTLNRPASRNAISGELLARLGEAMAAADADDEVRAVILTGADPAFCAGVDLKELDRQTSILREAASGGTGPWTPVSKPVIAAVNGDTADGRQVPARFPRPLIECGLHDRQITLASRLPVDDPLPDQRRHHVR